MIFKVPSNPNHSMILYMISRGTGSYHLVLVREEGRTTLCPT